MLLMLLPMMPRALLASTLLRYAIICYARHDICRYADALLMPPRCAYAAPRHTITPCCFTMLTMPAADDIFAITLRLSPLRLLRLSR